MSALTGSGFRERPEYEDAPEVAFTDGSVRDELLRLARTLNGLVEARALLHEEIGYLRDRLNPVLDLERAVPLEAARDRAIEAVKPTTEIAAEIRRLGSIIVEETDVILGEIREIVWLRERVAL